MRHSIIKGAKKIENEWWKTYQIHSEGEKGGGPDDNRLSSHRFPFPAPPSLFRN